MKSVMEKHLNQICSEIETNIKDAAESNNQETIKETDHELILQFPEDVKYTIVPKRTVLEQQIDLLDQDNARNILDLQRIPNKEFQKRNRPQEKHNLYRNNIKIYMMNNQYGGDDNMVMGDSFQRGDGRSRNPFIFRVLCIAFVMLLLTGIVCFYIQNTELRRVFKKNACIFSLVGGIGLLGVNLVLNYIKFTRQLPCNIVMLLLGVVFGICMTGVSIAFKNGKMISLAFIGTAVVVLVCMGLALTGFDFTKWLIYVVAIGMVLLLISLGAGIYAMCSKGKDFRVLDLVIGSLFLIMQVVMLIIELQMIIGGKSIEMAVDDYAIAAYMLFTSVLLLFLRILGLIATVDSMRGCFDDDFEDF